jgi:hypothetical protein
MKNQRRIVFVSLAISILTYVVGCLTIKYELFPYNLYKKWQLSNSSRLSSQQLFDLLKKGGYVVQWRHTHRNRLSMEKIPSSVDLNYSCADGANLTSLGIEQAKWIKLNLDKNKILAGEVHSSPACRLKQMCEIIFPNENVNFSDLLFYDRILTEKQIKSKIKHITRLLSEPISNSKNRFIMGHQGTYHPTKYDLPEGHSFVYKPLGNNQFKFLGTIDLVTWLP